MATLYITEYTQAGGPSGLGMLLPNDPPVAEQTVTIGSSSTQSAAFNAATTFIRVHTDAICSVLIGANPAAAATDARMAASTTEYRVVKPGHKIAVITNT